MAAVLINDTVKKYLLRQSKDFRRKIRERFEFLEAGLWEGRLRAKKIRHISSKCVFEAVVDKKNRILFTLGRYGKAGESLAVYVLGVVTHDELSRRSKNIIPENVPFLSFHDYEEAFLENIDLGELGPSCFTQEQITEKTREESGSQRWYPVQEPEWKRIELFTKDDFELFLYLTPEQKDVLGSSLPLLVSGTAGSGKTTLSVYYLLNTQLNMKKKIFITYNRYLKNFASRLYRGLLNETEWRDEVVPPDFYVFKEFNLEIAAQHGKIFLPEKEVDFNRFSRMFAAHSMHDKFNSALVWEEIRSIIKGALPQVNRSVLEKAICALKKDEVDPDLARKLQQQFILYSKLESLRAVDRFVSKYLKTDISTFSLQVEKYVRDEDYKDRVLSIMDRTLDELEKHREVVDKKYLSFLEYELLGKKKAPNFQFNRKEIYHIFEWYQNRLECDHMWDELDLSREVLKIYAEKDLRGDSYDVLACDEVQDFTDIQISLMFDMVEDPRHVFLAGDTKQTINPSGFRWEEVKRHFYERGLVVPELRSLALNFRSSGSIVELANVLLELKEKYLGIKAEEPKEDWKYKGRPVAVVSGIGEKEMLEIIRVAGAKRTLLVRTETEKERLKKILETELVFTMTEAKGLEFDTVVLWKFCDDQLVKDVWRVILDITRRAVHEAKIRHEINLLYVGITRSRKDLIIYDGEQPSFIWENQQLRNHVFVTDDRSYVEGIWNVLSTPEEWVEQGHYFFEREYYRAAMECFKNGGDPNLLSKASAYHYEKAGKYLDAAFHFEKIGESDRAAENYERAREFRKALWLWEQLKNEERRVKCLIEVYKQEGRYREAGHLYLEKRMYQEAVEYFQKSSDYRMIAEIYLKRLKKVKEAASFFELAHDFEKSAGLYNRLRSYEKAAELFFRGGNHLKAEGLWKKTKNTKRLLDLYEKTGQVEKSLILYPDFRH
jgi:tetratricopeptide (TPR) repeat protein